MWQHVAMTVSGQASNSVKMQVSGWSANSGKKRWEFVSYTKLIVYDLFLLKYKINSHYFIQIVITTSRYFSERPLRFSLGVTHLVLHEELYMHKCVHENRKQYFYFASCILYLTLILTVNIIITHWLVSYNYYLVSQIVQHGMLGF